MRKEEGHQCSYVAVHEGWLDAKEGAHGSTRLHVPVTRQHRHLDAARLCHGVNKQLKITMRAEVKRVKAEKRGRTRWRERGRETETERGGDGERGRATSPAPTFLTSFSPSSPSTDINFICCLNSNLPTSARLTPALSF